MANADFAVNTYAYTFSHTAEETLVELSDLGFTDFELMMFPGHAWPPDMDVAARRRLNKLVNDRGLSIISLNQPNIDLNIGAPTFEMREYSLSVLRSVIELAGDLGVPDVVISPGKANPLMPASKAVLTDRFHAALDVLVPLAAKAGTRLLVENIPFAYLPKADELFDAVDSYDSDTVGIIYDIANGYFVGEDLEAALKLLWPRLKMIHFSDTSRTQYAHAPVGAGTVDFDAVGATIRALKWNKKLVIEIVGLSDDPTHELLDSIRKVEALGWASN